MCEDDVLTKFGYNVTSCRNEPVVSRTKRAITFTCRNHLSDIPVKRNIAHWQGLIDNSTPNLASGNFRISEEFRVVVINTGRCLQLRFAIRRVITVEETQIFSVKGCAGTKAKYTENVCSTAETEIKSPLKCTDRPVRNWPTTVVMKR